MRIEILNTFDTILVSDIEDRIDEIECQLIDYDEWVQSGSNLVEDEDILLSYDEIFELERERDLLSDVIAEACDADVLIHEDHFGDYMVEQGWDGVSEFDTVSFDGVDYYYREG